MVLNWKVISLIRGHVSTSVSHLDLKGDCSICALEIWVKFEMRVREVSHNQRLYAGYSLDSGIALSVSCHIDIWNSSANY